MKNIGIIFFYTFLFTSITVLAQETKQPEIPREKVHIHSDRQTYSAGDTIWYKAYLALGQANQLQSLSKVLQVELIAPDLKVVSNQVLPINAGMATGNIQLPDSLPEGNYRLRAYTSWMRNFGDWTVFEKVIPIVNSYNPNLATVAPVASSGQKTDVQFFPEGGQLVFGLRSKVGVKLTGPDGLGKAGSGEILDSKGQLVTSFEAGPKGITAFALSPVNGERYTGRIRIKGEEDQLVQVPSALTAGYGLIVNTREADSLRITLSKSGLSAGQEVILQVSGMQLAIRTFRLRMEKDRYGFALAWTDLPPGINIVSLADSEKVYAERLVFNPKHSKLDLDLRIDKPEYQTGEKTNADLVVTSPEGGQSLGSYSVAITNADRVAYHDDKDLSIEANLLLTSDIKGKVEEPNYYFTGKTEDEKLERTVALDNLLLTQGWRKYTWQESGEDFTQLKFSYPPEQGLRISGKLSAKNGNPIPDSKITLFYKVDSLPVYKETETLEDGSFSFSELDFPGETSVAIQSKDVKNKYTVNVLIDSIKKPVIQPLEIRAAEPQTDPLIWEAAKVKTNGLPGRFSQRGKVLDEVVVTEKKIAYSSSVGGAAYADRVISEDRLKGQHNLKNALQTYVPYMRFNLLGEPSYDAPRMKIPEFVAIVDGLQVGVEAISAIRPEDVSSIEVLLSAANRLAYGEEKGVIIINTHRKDPNFNWNKVPAAGIRVIRVQGYSEGREFYVPKYAPTDSNPDLRDVVYWNPDIVTDQEGKAGFSFFNSSRVGKYRMIVEGMRLDGRMGRKVIEYELK